MFKHAAYAAAAAAAFIAVPASAATVVGAAGTAPGATVTLSPSGPFEEAGLLGFTVNGTAGAFTAYFQFQNLNFDPAQGTSTVTFSSNDGDSVQFTGAAINGLAGTLTINNEGPDAASVFVFQSPLALGTHYLTIDGTFNPAAVGAGNGFATVGGTITLNAVPEPATWALFILGFGAVGHTMRRRSSKVRVSKASLNLA